MAPTVVSSAAAPACSTVKASIAAGSSTGGVSPCAVRRGAGGRFGAGDFASLRARFAAGRLFVAISSSLRGKPLPKGFIAFGEVGLAGEVRPAPRGQERLKEAAKLGFSVAIVPKANAPKAGGKPNKDFEGLTIHAVERIEEAMQIVRGL